MEKTKQRKKYWAWTEAQKRRKTKGRYWNRIAPRWYRREFDVKTKTKVKKALHQIVLGYDEDDVDFSRAYHQSCANWYWW
jgi:hypothetical protein